MNVWPLTPAQVVAQVSTLHSEYSHPVCAFWVAVPTERDLFASSLREVIGDGAVVPIVVRGVLFQNPNEILNDLARVLDSQRAELEALPTRLGARPARVAVILIGRSELIVPQVASPITLPTWFPVAPGETLSTVIHDLTWTTDGSLSSEDVRVPEICGRLFGLEGRLLARLREAHEADHTASNAFYELFRRRGPGEEAYSDFLRGAVAAHAAIKNPESFRPSVKVGASLIGRLWEMVNSTSPDGLAGCSKALSRALGIEEASVGRFHEGVQTVLTRPSTRDAIPGRKVARALLVTVAGSCQLITASAHADEYPRYPIPLLRSLSYDLRRSLSDLEDILS